MAPLKLRRQLERQVALMLATWSRSSNLRPPFYPLLLRQNDTVPANSRHPRSKPERPPCKPELSQFASQQTTKSRSPFDSNPIPIHQNSKSSTGLSSFFYHTTKPLIPFHPMFPTLFFFFLFVFLSASSSSSQVSISISLQVLQKSGDEVRITWSGIDTPSNLDWLGIYSPSNSSNADFIGYVFLSSSSPTWRSGSGSLHLPLVNLRSEYQFRIFRWTADKVNNKHCDHNHNPLPGTKHLQAESGSLGFEMGRGPDQVRIAYTGSDDEMRVMFITGGDGEGFVKYGLGEDRMTEVVRTQVGTYGKEDMCDSPANESVGWREKNLILWSGER